MKKGIILICSLLLFACKKDPKPIKDNGQANNDPFAVKGNVYFNFTNMAGSQVLVLNAMEYINLNSDTFNVSLFKYYISNIRLFREDGYIFTEPESYRLMDHADSTATCKFTMPNVPVGNYIGMEFIIGVDSLRNTQGSQSGPLDPANDMFWSWAQGYIFTKMEGMWKNGSPPSSFSHHIGGFSGIYNCIEKANPPFNGKVIQVDSDHTSEVYLKANMMEWFNHPNLIDLPSFFAVSGGKKAKTISVNYSDMFSVAAIKH